MNFPELTGFAAIGGPAEIHRLQSSLPQMNTINSPFQNYLGRFFSGIELISSTLVEPGYVYMMQNGKVVAKLDMGGGQMFLAKWKRDGDDLRVLIERLEQYQ